MSLDSRGNEKFHLQGRPSREMEINDKHITKSLVVPIGGEAGTFFYDLVTVPNL